MGSILYKCLLGMLQIAIFKFFGPQRLKNVLGIGTLVCGLTVLRGYP